MQGHENQPSGAAKTSHCEYCLQEHAEDGSCFCADCKCDMHPEFIVPYRDGNTRISLCPDCYKSRRAKKSKQVDNTTCPSCGVAYNDHLGLIPTCAKLHVELENKAALEAYIAKIEQRSKRLFERCEKHIAYFEYRLRDDRNDERDIGKFHGCIAAYRQVIHWLNERE